MYSHNALRCRNYLSTLNHFARMFGLDVRGLRQGLAKSPRFEREFVRYRQMTSQQGRLGPPHRFSEPDVPTLMRRATKPQGDRCEHSPTPETAPEVTRPAEPTSSRNSPTKVSARVWYSR
jgi:hypothetical protein